MGGACRVGACISVSHFRPGVKKAPEAAATDLARLSPLVPHFFKPPEHAIMYLSPELDEVEGLFLLLVLVTSETKRRDVCPCTPCCTF